jgi:hypothetical protein
MKLVVLATLVTVGAAVGFSVSTGGAASELRFFIHDTHQAQLDLGQQGDGVEDRYVFSGDVFDHEGGTKIGRIGGSCDAVSRDAKGDGEDFCSTTTVLAEGNLTSSIMADHAAFFGGTPVAAAMTGGTGIYRTARGEATVTVLNATDANVVIRLS